ncbi:hypothetical protein ABZ858_01580 [Streptomyces sp. NPDC047017]|uniref:hypothetical protein n=1 Tax=Streptomyces sp. NPDC047017 TaxID=3155024 RepID=UPI0033E46D6C
MKAPRARRLTALSVAGLLLAGGAAIGTAGTASAAAPATVKTAASHGCGGWYGNCGYGHRGGAYYGPGYGYGYGFGAYPSSVVVIVV